MSLKTIKKLTFDKYEPDCAVWEITLKCNLKCIHCGSSAGINRKDELSFAEIKNVVNDLKKIKFKRVSLIGGEPFLRSDWYEIAKLIKNAGLGITYVSNGYLFPENKELVEKVITTAPQTIGFSLDGGLPETHDKIRGLKGSFKRVLESIKIFQDAGMSVSIITTLNRLNVNELPFIRDLILGKGIGWQIQIASKNGARFKSEWFLTKEEYFGVARFIHENATNYSTDDLPIAGADDIGYFSAIYPFCSINYDSWNGCKAGKTNLFIQSNGNIKGCGSLPNEYIEGNIRKPNSSLYDIWNDPNSFSYTRGFKKDMLKGFCGTCKHGSICKGGCVDISHSISGHAFENLYCLYKNEFENNQIMH